MKNITIDDSNRCVCCGEIIPEGVMICQSCQAKSKDETRSRYETHPAKNSRKE